MKNFALTTALLLGISSTAWGGGFCEGQRARSNAEQLAQLEPSVELDLIDLDLFNGGNVVGGYEYEVEPAYTNGLYARSDRWQIGTNLVPQAEGESGEPLEWRFGLGARYANEVQFVRFFKDACRAEIAKPYSPRRIPLRAERALSNKFNPGDYFLFKSTLGFVVNADILQLLGTPMAGVGLHAGYLVEGSYQAHVVRQDTKHVRLKLVARRGREGTLGLSLGISREAFDVFGVSALNGQLRRLVNPQPIKVNYHESKSNVFLIDYVLDLSNPEVAAAFNKVMRRARDFQSLQLAQPFRDRESLEQGLILDINPLEDLYRQDYANNSIGRIRRNLRSSSQQNGRRFNVEVGNSILGFDFDATSSTSRMTLREPDNSISRYLLKSFDRTYDGQLAFSWARLYTKRSVEVLLKANNDFSDLTAMNLSQTLERRDKRLSPREFEEIQQTLRKALPKATYESIPFATWGEEQRNNLKNFGMRFQVVMGPEIVLNTTTMSADEVKVLYRDYLASKGLGARDFYSTRASSAGRSPQTPEQQLQSAINRIGAKLAKASDTRLGDLQRLEEFMELRNNSVFSQTGIGFLMTLQPNQTFRFDLNLSANGRRLDYAVGDEATARFYRQLLLIKAALEDEGLDLRREAESLAPEMRSSSLL